MQSRVGAGVRLLRRPVCACALTLISPLVPPFAAPAFAQSIDELRDMSIGALADLDVTSVTRSAGALADAPAAIYVITHDDIVRSGTLTLSGILRLAPNLQIARGGRDVAITARGLSGNEDAQNFPNKLLVMIDGRSVYTPLYSGVYWDMQDVLPEDVERIEVISGPGATLWGTNAVNGVINIITRNPGATQGLYGTGVVGNRTYDAGLRYGGHAGETVNYRFFVKRHEVFETSDGANDGNRRTQAGFRVDWSPSARDVVMVQGDGYAGSQAPGLVGDDRIRGYDVVARWRRTMSSGSAIQVQTYYDHAARSVAADGGHFSVDTFDGEFQHSFTLGGAHSIVWGGGLRVNKIEVVGLADIAFVPARRSLVLANMFAQDSIALTPKLTAIVGLKVEDGAYTGATLLPSARLSWKANGSSLFWAAVSRAVRAPTPFDRDVVETVQGQTIVQALQSFRSEKLTAFEAGTRLTLSSQASVSVSGFYNAYDDVRSIEPAPGGLLPLYWGNGIAGHTYGLDAWADVRLADWWRIKPGYSLLIEKFHFKDGASQLFGLAQVGNDPRHRGFLRSSMDIGPRINLDADLRYVSALPNPFTPSYVELGARIGWQFAETAEFSVSGFNLLHDQHQELPATWAPPASRTIFAALKWTL